VLPFANLSGDPRQEYFSDGISNQLIEDLSRLPGLFVIARNSSFAYKGKTIGEQEVGRELGVRYLLEGSVQKAPNQIRVGVQLVDASVGTEIWAQRFDRPLTDIFAVQDEIVKKVVTTLGLIFNSAEAKVPWGKPSAQTTNVEAYDDFLRAGEYMARFTKDDASTGRRWFEKALSLDPGYADAYTSLAWSYYFPVVFGWSENPAADLSDAS
jgi:adenylate cyclase